MTATGRSAIRRAEAAQDNHCAGACCDALVLPALLAVCGRVDDDFFDAGFGQRKQMIDMPVKLLFAAAVAPESESQSFHRAAGVNIGAGGKTGASQFSHVDFLVPLERNYQAVAARVR